MERPDFHQCITMLRSPDPMTYEDGYQWMQGYLSDYIDELISLMKSESVPDIRAKFVELIGDSQLQAAIPVLEEELKSPHSEVRQWAYSSLQYFEDHIANQIAERFRLTHPHEEFL